MRRFLIALALTLTAAAPASAQAITLQKFYFSGCDAGWSCMELVVTTPADRSDPFGFNVLFAWTATFFGPGIIDRIWLDSNYGGGPGHPDDYIGNYPVIYQLGNVSGSIIEHRPIGWEPLGGWYTTDFGAEGTHADWNDLRSTNLQLTHTTVTPEPASILLLATGMLGIGARRWRKRRRRNLSSSVRRSPAEN